MRYREDEHTLWLRGSLLDVLMDGSNLSQAKMLKAHLGILHNSIFLTIRAGRSKYIPFSTQFCQMIQCHISVTSLSFRVHHDLLAQELDPQTEP